MRESAEEPGTVRLQIYDSDATGSVNWVHFGADSLITRSTVFNEPYLLLERRPVLEWNMVPESRDLGGYRTFKATAEFRGRTYTAWYCPGIPVPAGPWKLQGLPGLILEAYDGEGVFHARFTELVYGQESLPDARNLLRAGRRMDWEEYLAMRGQLAEELVRRIASRLPRGTAYQVESYGGNFLEIGPE